MHLPGLSGLTSQPSMGAIVGALEGTPLDTGLSLQDLSHLNDYWEMTRGSICLVGFMVTLLTVATRTLCGFRVAKFAKWQFRCLRKMTLLEDHWFPKSYKCYCDRFMRCLEASTPICSTRRLNLVSEKAGRPSRLLTRRLTSSLHTVSSVSLSTWII